MTNTVRRLGDLRGPDVASKITSRSIFVQPLGAIEQHGPHLPLNTDEVVATSVAQATVELVGEDLDVWLLPTLSYTKSNEHAWAPGTIWLSVANCRHSPISVCIFQIKFHRVFLLFFEKENSILP